PNGSGKTTLLMAIMGFPKYQVTKGNIIFKGNDITGLPVDERARLGIGMSFQRPPVVRGVKTRDMITACLKGQEDEERVSQLARKADLADFLNRELNYGFSGGEIKRGREFLQLAKHISTRKPVMVWKAGRTEAGVRAVASHTGALAGSGAVFDAALRQSGIVSAQNLEELIDLAVGFTCPVMPGGNRLGVLAESGSGAVASADIYKGLGLEMPILSRETQKEVADTVQDIIPAFPSLQNPVDIVWIPLEHSARVFLQCSRLILKEVDAALLVDYTPLDKYYSS
ncbi:unnamed protein product, partial [marine sediment metagenome]